MLENNDIVHYKAYNEIILENFETEDGSEFIAEIVSCPSSECDFIDYKTSSSNKNIKPNNKQIIQQNKILVYPNPNNGIFTFESNINNTGVIKIYNCIGNLVFTKKLNSNEFTIDLYNKPNGIYILKYISLNYNYEQKIIKQ